MASAAAAKKWPRPSHGFFGSSTDQPEVRLVDQGRGFQRLPRLLVGHFLRRQFAQFVVDQRQELAGSASVSVLDRGKDAGDVGHRGVQFAFPDPSVVVGTCCALIRSGKDVRHDDLADLDTLDHNGNVLSLDKLDARSIAGRGGARIDFDLALNEVDDPINRNAGRGVDIRLHAILSQTA